MIRSRKGDRSSSILLGLPCWAQAVTETPANREPNCRVGHGAGADGGDHLKAHLVDMATVIITTAVDGHPGDLAYLFGIPNGAVVAAMRTLHSHRVPPG